jgi:membrane-associated protease RseP (regulator of RpoE activity)
MLELIFNFIIKYKFIFLFYLLVIIFLIVKRKRLTYQAKIIVLYRTKFGLNFIDKCNKKFREWVVLIGYIGVGAGYVGLIFISYVMIKNLYDLIIKPSAVNGVSLVLPGINVPGLGVLPFWYWIIAIFIIALVHEFGHGVVARAHNIEVKNTGLVLFGPIIGAFVEPEEKKLRKEKDIVQYSVLAAGPFANVLLAILALGLLSLVFSPLQQAMVEPTGFTFDNYVDDTYPFAVAGIQPGTIITGINGQETLEFQTFSDQLFCIAPGKEVDISTKDKNYSLALGISPDDQSKSFMGIKEIHNEFELKTKYSSKTWSAVYYSLDWITGFLRWLFLLSLGIGLFNLLPLPIVDGGRMMQVTLHRLKGEDKGEKRYKQISLFFLLILVLNLFYPLLKGLLGI